jgi:glycosyltransferase involved in cell wall biosynthesis
MTEALACGTPVISFPEGAAPEIIEHGKTGYLCEDEAEMVEAVRHIGDLDRGVCRAAVEGYFSTQRMVDDHVELYEAILARR